MTIKVLRGEGDEVLRDGDSLEDAVAFAKTLSSMSDWTIAVFDGLELKASFYKGKRLED